MHTLTVSRNNGKIKNYSNSCLFISILHYLYGVHNIALDVDVLRKDFKGYDEKFDFNNVEHIILLEELTDKFLIHIIVYSFNLKKGYIPWIGDMIRYESNNNHKNIIPIIYYGEHFELITNCSAPNINLQLINNLPSITYEITTQGNIYEQSIKMKNKKTINIQNLGRESIRHTYCKNCALLIDKLDTAKEQRDIKCDIILYDMAETYTELLNVEIISDELLDKNQKDGKIQIIDQCKNKLKKINNNFNVVVDEIENLEKIKIKFKNIHQDIKSLKLLLNDDNVSSSDKSTIKLNLQTITKEKMNLVQHIQNYF